MKLKRRVLVRWANDFLDVANAPSIAIVGDISSYFVVKFDDFATYRAVWAKTIRNLPAPNDYYLLPNSGLPRAFRGDGTAADIGSVDGTTAIRPGNYGVLGFQMSGTTFTHYLNDQTVGFGGITARIGDGGTGLKIGTRDDFFTKMKGDIAELVIFDRALTEAERTTLLTYLQTKYGIVNQPPTINLTSPTNNTSVAAPGTITLSVNAADPDGVVSKVDFFANGVLIGTATAPPYKIQLRLESPGTVTLGAVATDNKDATATVTNVVVTATGTISVPLITTNNLQLWLKADAGVTTDTTSRVTTWKDQSGKGNDAVSPSGAGGPVMINNAVNGKPVVRFNGQSDYLDVASSASVSITGDIASFFVVNFSDFETFRAVWAKTSGNLPRPTDYYLLPSSGVPRVFRGSENGGVSVDGGKVPAGTYVLLGFGELGTTMTHYFNGSPSGAGPMYITPTDSETPLKIGARDDLGTKMKGDIAELLIYDKALSAAERSALAIYLGSKYGIPIVQLSNSLPVVTITSPASGSLTKVPTNITVTATASDSDGSIVKVDFFANGGFVGSSAQPPYQAQFLAPVGGGVVLTAVATDNLGGQITSPQVLLTATDMSPRTLPITTNLVLWLKADGGVTANSVGLVSGWVDFSGNFNNAAQLDLTVAPLLVTNGLNHLPTLRFDGLDDYLEIRHSSSLVITGNVTSLCVVEFDDFTTYRAIWAQTAGNQPRSIDYYLQPNTGTPHFIRGGPAALGSSDGAKAPTPSTFSIVGFEMIGTAVTHYLNGATNGGGNITAMATDTGASVRIGTRDDFGTWMKGDISEILVYNTGLSDDDRNKVTDYLHTKYFVSPLDVRFTAIRIQGAGVVIEWQTNASLEEAVQVAGPWTAIADAKSPYVVAFAGKQKFYRLRI